MSQSEAEQLETEGKVETAGARPTKTVKVLDTRTRS